MIRRTHHAAFSLNNSITSGTEPPRMAGIPILTFLDLNSVLDPTIRGANARAAIRRLPGNQQAIIDRGKVKAPDIDAPNAFNSFDPHDAPQKQARKFRENRVLEAPRPPNSSKHHPSWCSEFNLRFCPTRSRYDSPFPYDLPERTCPSDEPGCHKASHRYVSYNCQSDG